MGVCLMYTVIQSAVDVMINLRQIFSLFVEQIEVGHAGECARTVQVPLLSFGTEASAISVIFGIKSAVLPDQLIGGIVAVRHITILADHVFQTVIVEGTGTPPAAGHSQCQTFCGHQRAGTPAVRTLNSVAKTKSPARNGQGWGSFFLS